MINEIDFTNEWTGTYTRTFHFIPAISLVTERWDNTSQWTIVCSWLIVTVAVRFDRPFGD
ncbi:MAG TPA: hypothetical protein EYQ21_02410 [Flavobacteriales bacterium]|nr:hypothetical protein [Flavobacteriales bacterium]